MSKKYIPFLMLVTCCCATNLILSQTFWITSNADNGPGTVRQAITDLNNSIDATNEIKVALAGNTTVALESELPVISKQVTFNGQDQLSPALLILTANVPLAHVIIVGSNTSTLKNITINNVDLFMRAALIINAENCAVENCNIENIQGVSAGTSPSSGTVIGIQVISGSTTTLSNCVIDTLSNASELSIMYGIELSNFSSSVVIDTCTISNLQGSGSGTGAQASTILAGIHSDNSVGNLTIMNVSIEDIHNDIENGQAYGILHEESGSSSSTTTITDCTITTISSGVKTTINSDDSRAAGIRSTNEIGPVLRNTITGVSSTNSPANAESGMVYGILLNTNNECSTNTVSHISGGEATSGSTSFGIAITNPVDCSFNTVSTITSGTALVSQATGIFIANLIEANCDANIINTVVAKTVAIGIAIFFAQKLEMDSTLSANTIDTIQSESASFGIVVTFCKELPIVINLIQNIEALSGVAYGIALGGSDGGTELFVTDTAIAENVIRHIHGATEGIGIILLDNALHNVMLGNIICDVTTKGIGVPNSPVDAVCVLLRSFLLPNGDVRVRGLLSQVASVNQEYFLQFFANQCNTVPEAPRFIKQVSFRPTSTPSPFDITFTPTSPVEKNQYITMTATLAFEALTQRALNNNTFVQAFQNNNTSELSNTRRVRTDADSLCTFVCNNGTDAGSCCFISR